MAFDEEAKAAQEIAKTSGKAIDATREAGDFIAKYIDGPLSAASGILEDKLKIARWERQVRFMVRAREFLGEVGLPEPTRKIALKIAVPLLEAASLEEDDELQDVWAKLFVNAANADSGVEIRRAFLSILEDMGSLEVRILEAIVHAPADLDVGQNMEGYVPTAGLPEQYAARGAEGWCPEPKGETAVTLWNLSRLGCVEPTLTMGGLSIRTVRPTPLGDALVRACTLQKQ